MNTTDFIDIEDARRAEQAFRDHLAALTADAPIADFDQLMTAALAQTPGPDLAESSSDRAVAPLPVPVLTPPRRTRWVAIGFAAAASLTVMVVVGALVLSATGQRAVAPLAPTNTETPVASDVRLPRVTVKRAMATGNAEVPARWAASVQKFADDIADGNIDLIVGSCYRIPAQDVRADYGTLAQRQAVLQALSAGTVTDDSDANDGVWKLNGAAWYLNDAKQHGLAFTAADLSVSYACPSFNFLEREHDAAPSAAQFSLDIKRLLALHRGTPYRPDDAKDGVVDTLVCSRSVWVPAHYPFVIDGIKSITSEQWRLLDALAKAPLNVHASDNGDYRGWFIWAADGSTTAMASFYGGDSSRAHPLTDVIWQ